MRKNRKILLIIPAVLVIIGIIGLVTDSSIVSWVQPEEQELTKQIEPIKEMQVLDQIQTSPPLEFVSEPQDLPEQSVNVNSLALEIFDRVNQERAGVGVSQLSWNSQIAAVAESHSLDMMNRNYFAHASPDGISPADRGVQSGFGICGDPQAIQLDISLDQRLETYDLKLDDYNSRKAKLEQDVYYRDNFGQNNIGLTNQINQEYQELEALGQQLDSDYMILSAEIETYNQQTSDMLAVGFGENLMLLRGYAQNQIVDKSIQGWLDSPPHKENMLLPYWTMAGIGVSYDQDLNKYIITNDFC